MSIFQKITVLVTLQADLLSHGWTPPAAVDLLHGVWGGSVLGRSVAQGGVILKGPPIANTVQIHPFGTQLT